LIVDRGDIVFSFNGIHRNFSCFKNQLFELNIEKLTRLLKEKESLNIYSTIFEARFEEENPHSKFLLEKMERSMKPNRRKQKILPILRWAAKNQDMTSITSG